MPPDDGRFTWIDQAATVDVQVLAAGTGMRCRGGRGT